MKKSKLLPFLANFLLHTISDYFINVNESTLIEPTFTLLVYVFLLQQQFSRTFPPRNVAELQNVIIAATINV